MFEYPYLKKDCVGTFVQIARNFLRIVIKERELQERSCAKIYPAQKTVRETFIYNNDRLFRRKSGQEIDIRQRKFCHKNITYLTARIVWIYNNGSINQHYRVIKKKAELPNLISNLKLLFIKKEIENPTI